jgi:hypothetical protein
MREGIAHEPEDPGGIRRLGALVGDLQVPEETASGTGNLGVALADGLQARRRAAGGREHREDEK